MAQSDVKAKSTLTEPERALREILLDKHWYSIGAESCCARLKCGKEELKVICKTLGEKCGDAVNFFSFSDIEFCGYVRRG